MSFLITPNMSMTFSSAAIIILLCILLLHFKKIKIGIWIIPIIFLLAIEFSSALYGDFLIIEFIKLAAIIILVAILIYNDGFNLNPLITIKSFIIGVIVGFTSVLIQTLNFYSLDEFFSYGKRIGKTAQFTEDTAMSISLNPNTIGMLSAIGISMCFCIIIYYKLLKIKINRIVILSVLLFLLLMGFFSMSKAFFIELILIFVLLLFEYRKNIKRLFNLVIIISVFIILGLPTVNHFFPNLIPSLLARFTIGDISSGRIGIFSKYNEVFVNNPQWWLFGSGIQNYRIKAGISDSIHNAIQQVYFTWGVVGLFIAILYFKQIIYSVYNKINKSERILTFLIPFIILLIAIQSSRFFSSFYTILLLIPIHSALNLNYIYINKIYKKEI